MIDCLSWKIKTNATSPARWTGGNLEARYSWLAAQWHHGLAASLSWLPTGCRGVVDLGSWCCQQPGGRSSVNNGAGVPLLKEVPKWSGGLGWEQLPCSAGDGGCPREMRFILVQLGSKLGRLLPPLRWDSFSGGVFWIPACVIATFQTYRGFGIE